MTALALRLGSIEPQRWHWPAAPMPGDNQRVLAYPARRESAFESAGLTAPTGLEAVMAANRALLARFARLRLRDEEAVEDILQELWLKVRIVDSGPIAEPLAYLYRMTENLVLDRKRAEQRRVARDHQWAERRAGNEDLTADAAPSPERIVIARDFLHRVDARLAQLPERTAYVFRAVRIDKRAQKELAVELGISVSAVEKHLQRAYREIVSVREELEGAQVAPPDQVREGVGHDG